MLGDALGVKVEQKTMSYLWHCGHKAIPALLSTNNHSGPALTFARIT
jgi:hypothetical protein